MKFKLSWESIGGHAAASLAEQYGKKYWSRMTDDQKAQYDWHETVKETDDEDGVRAQHEMLARWEKDGTQPIRSVRLQKATTEIVWEDVP